MEYMDLKAEIYIEVYNKKFYSFPTRNKNIKKTENAEWNLECINER